MLNQDTIAKVKASIDYKNSLATEIERIFREYAAAETEIPITVKRERLGSLSTMIIIRGDDGSEGEPCIDTFVHVRSSGVIDIDEYGSGLTYPMVSINYDLNESIEDVVARMILVMGENKHGHLPERFVEYAFGGRVIMDDAPHAQAEPSPESW